MDFQLLFNIACSIVGTVAGWLFKVLWDAIQDLKNDVKEIEKGYVQKDDYRIDIAEIKGMLARIFDKLDMKADK
jgi:hypothetical protein